MKPNPRLYVGIDFSKNMAHFSLQQADGQPLVKQRAFANSLAGFQQAKELLLKTLQEQELDGLELAGESTSYYWLPMFIQLAEDRDLAAYQTNLFLLNARWVHWFKKSRSPNHKDDPTDAADVASYLRVQAPSIPWEYDPHWLPLRFYTRLRFHLVKSLTREKNLFNQYLFLLYNTFTRLRPFSEPLGSTSRTLLTHPEQMEQLRALSEAELAQQLDKLSNHRLPDPHKNASRLRQVLTDSFPVAPALAEPLQHGLELLLETIDHLEEQIAQVERDIASLVQDNYPEVAWLDSIPGVGPVLASGVAAEIGSLGRFLRVPVWDPHRRIYRPRRSQEVVDAVSKYAGLWWPKNASGQFAAEERRMSREGNAYLRYYVLEAADRMRQKIPSFKSYYQQKYAQANKHKHKRALVLTGSKALDLFVTLLRRREGYRPKEGDGASA